MKQEKKNIRTNREWLNNLENDELAFILYNSGYMKRVFATSGKKDPERAFLAWLEEEFKDYE